MVEKLTVLFADDDQASIESWATKFEERGMTVKRVASGDAAFHLLETTPVDVVIFDIMMAGAAGIDVLKALRDAFPSVAWVILSGHADITTAIDTMEEGAFDYLIKPVQFDELLFRIQDAYRSKRIDGYPV